MAKLIVKVEGSPLPRYSTPGASGADIYAKVERDVVIKPGEWSLIPTGIRIQIPQDYEGQIRPRSGLALKHGIGLLNSPGTIDSDYRGEVKIILFNFGKEDFVVRDGDRIAQLVIGSSIRVEFVSSKLDNTERGDGGFGHTGINQDGCH